MKNLMILLLVFLFAGFFISCSESTSSNDDTFSDEAANGYLEYYNWYRGIRSMNDVQMNADLVKQAKNHCSKLSLNSLNNHDEYDYRVAAIKKIFANAKNITEITGKIVRGEDNYTLTDANFYPNTSYNESLYDFIGIAAKKSDEKDTWIATVIVIDSN